ncbi:MAG: phosphatidylglycerol---prolipoprotein diacylglyceryl transferase [Acidobacteriota bacterium]|jgi:phosphatidylglycerol:prolipoprotein diacylglycerol transferase|nr:phosphatidylglycerol---prolipoprotein diacylglyceryl transferase [Acidobacteriota bacterium]
MIQELFRIGPFAISPFGVMLVLSFVAGYLQLLWGMRRFGLGDDEDASAIVFAAGVGGIVGAKVYYALLNRDLAVLFDRSGLVWYGGFILGAAAVLFTLYKRRLFAWRMLDVAALALALGYAVGRIGCFLVGDDYGRPTDLPWGVAFPVGLPPTTAGELRSLFGVDIPASVPDSELLRVHPTQIYETLTCLAIWGFGLWLLRRRLGEKPGEERGVGVVALTVLALMAVERFLVEILRAKDDRFFGPFTLAQVISVIIVAVVLAVSWMRRRRLHLRTA